MTIASDNEFPKLILVEGDTPVTPSSGQQKLFIDSADHKVKRIDASGTVMAVGSSSPDYILLQERQNSGVPGGTFSNSDWVTRSLNTEVFDTGNHATLANKQFTLAAGTYQILARAPAIKVENHIAVLYNVTDGAIQTDGSNPIVGSSAYAYAGGGASDSVIQGRFTIEASKAFEIRHRCYATCPYTYGLGADNGFGVVNIYTSVELWKVD